MRTRLEPWRHRLLAVVGAAPLICCGGSSFSGDDEDAGGAGTSGVGGSSSGKGGASSGKGGSDSPGGSSSGGVIQTGGMVGNGGFAASAGSAMGGSGAGPNQACVNPQPMGDTGFELCDGGFMHRPAIKSCELGLPREEQNVEPTEFDSCSADSDCVDAPYGYCDIAGGQLPGRMCFYGCVSDGDCDPGSICLCGSPVGTCITASCSSDMDCGGDFLCASHAGISCMLGGFACQTASDTCVGDVECSAAGFGACVLGASGSRQCNNVCPVPGRPFLIGSEARLAGETPRRDWLAAIEAPDLAGLSAAEREALAAYWTRAGMMEHASVAAFARFSLGLLALGAPAELVQASSDAGSDEIRHARACFALASAYAERPIGPGPIDVRGALDELSLASLLSATIHEGCAGETLAAIEAAEQAALATDPAVGRLLGAIAEDEARHAELAWRFVAWAIERGGEPLGQLARAEFARLLAASEPELTPGLELERHGVLSPQSSHALRRRALDEVVLPCARALFERSRSAAEAAPSNASA